MTTPRFRFSRRLAITVAALAVALCLVGPLAATGPVAKSTGLACTACHDKPGSKLLTDQGKYYELMGSLDGFAGLEATFQACTKCHVAKPGSKKMTAEGKKFAELVKDMQGLRDWLAKQHPKPPAQ